MGTLLEWPETNPDTLPFALIHGGAGEANS